MTGEKAASVSNQPKSRSLRLFSTKSESKSEYVTELNPSLLSATKMSSFLLSSRMVLCSVVHVSTIFQEKRIVPFPYFITVSLALLIRWFYVAFTAAQWLQTQLHLLLHKMKKKNLKLVCYYFVYLAQCLTLFLRCWLIPGSHLFFHHLEEY